jgi:hypothetical protein
MAKKTITTITIVDDLDGTPIEDGQANSIRFSIDGTNYEIDLSKQNAKLFWDAMKAYVKAATIVAAPRPYGGASKSTKSELDAPRAWLRANGHEVSDRGRIKGELMELYRSNR